MTSKLDLEILSKGRTSVQEDFRKMIRRINDKRKSDLNQLLVIDGFGRRGVPISGRDHFLAC